MPYPTAESILGALKGRVVDVNGEPVASARIWARWPHWLDPVPCARSDADGRFLVEGVIAFPQVKIWIDSPRHYWSMFPVVAFPRYTHDVGEFMIARLRAKPKDPAGIEVDGVVVDEDGRPMADVRVRCGLLEPRHQVTGADGRFQFHAVEPDDRVIVVSKPEHRTDVTGTPGGTGLVITLPPKRLFRFRVIDRVSGEPLSHAHIADCGRETADEFLRTMTMYTETSDGGMADVECYLAGALRFEVGDVGYVDQVGHIDVAERASEPIAVEVALERTDDFEEQRRRFATRDAYAVTERNVEPHPTRRLCWSDWPVPFVHGDDCLTIGDGAARPSRSHSTPGILAANGGFWPQMKGGSTVGIDEPGERRRWFLVGDDEERSLLPLPTGTIRGRIVGFTPALRGLLYVVAFREDPVFADVEVDRDGCFALPDFPAGRVALAVARRGAPDSSARTSAEAWRAATVLELGEGQTIEDVGLAVPWPPRIRRPLPRHRARRRGRE